MRDVFNKLHRHCGTVAVSSTKLVSNKIIQYLLSICHYERWSLTSINILFICFAACLPLVKVTLHMEKLRLSSYFSSQHQTVGNPDIGLEFISDCGNPRTIQVVCKFFIRLYFAPNFVSIECLLKRFDRDVANDCLFMVFGQIRLGCLHWVNGECDT